MSRGVPRHPINLSIRHQISGTVSSQFPAIEPRTRSLFTNMSGVQSHILSMDCGSKTYNEDRTQILPYSQSTATINFDTGWIKDTVYSSGLKVDAGIFSDYFFIYYSVIQNLKMFNGEDYTLEEDYTGVCYDKVRLTDAGIPVLTNITFVQSDGTQITHTGLATCTGTRQYMGQANYFVDNLLNTIGDVYTTPEMEADPNFYVFIANPARAVRTTTGMWILTYDRNGQTVIFPEVTNFGYIEQLTGGMVIPELSGEELTFTGQLTSSAVITRTSGGNTYTVGMYNTIHTGIRKGAILQHTGSGAYTVIQTGGYTPETLTDEPYLAKIYSEYDTTSGGYYWYIGIGADFDEQLPINRYRLLFTVYDGGSYNLLLCMKHNPMALVEDNFQADRYSFIQSRRIGSGNRTISAELSNIEYAADLITITTGGYETIDEFYPTQLGVLYEDSDATFGFRVTAANLYDETNGQPVYSDTIAIGRDNYTHTCILPVTSTTDYYYNPSTSLNPTTVTYPHTNTFPLGDGSYRGLAVTDNSGLGYKEDYLLSNITITDDWIEADFPIITNIGNSSGHIRNRLVRYMGRDQVPSPLLDVFNKQATFRIGTSLDNRLDWSATYNTSCTYTMNFDNPNHTVWIVLNDIDGNSTIEICRVTMHFVNIGNILPEVWYATVATVDMYSEITNTDFSDQLEELFYKCLTYERDDTDSGITVHAIY